MGRTTGPTAMSIILVHVDGHTSTYAIPVFVVEILLVGTEVEGRVESDVVDLHLEEETL